MACKVSKHYRRTRKGKTVVAAHVRKTKLTKRKNYGAYFDNPKERERLDRIQRNRSEKIIAPPKTAPLTYAPHNRTVIVDRADPNNKRWNDFLNTQFEIKPARQRIIRANHKVN